MMATQHVVGHPLGLPKAFDRNALLTKTINGFIIFSACADSAHLLQDMRGAEMAVVGWGAGETVVVDGGTDPHQGEMAEARMA